MSFMGLEISQNVEKLLCCTVHTWSIQNMQLCLSLSVLGAFCTHTALCDGVHWAPRSNMTLLYLIVISLIYMSVINGLVLSAAQLCPS